MDQNILCSLDVILDTRIATVDLLNSKAAADLLGSAYLSRKTDDMGKLTPHITTEEYRAAYAKRDKSVLKRTRITAFMPYLVSILRRLDLSRINTPHTSSVALDLNIYPYILTDEEKQVMVGAIRAYIGEIIPINIVSYAPRELTLRTIKTKWSCVIIYDLMEWLSAQFDNDLIGRVEDGASRCPEVTLIAPEIYHDSNALPTEEDIVKMPDGSMDSPAALEAIMAEFIGLNIMDLDMFSILPPPPDEAPSEDKPNQGDTP